MSSFIFSIFSIFHALFILFDDEKHNFIINGNLVPALCVYWAWKLKNWKIKTRTKRQNEKIFSFEPLFSTGIWLHFIIAITASATLGNSIKPDDDRSVFNGNIRTAVGDTSFELNIFTNCSSVRLGGVLKKCNICSNDSNNIFIGHLNSELYLHKIYLARWLNTIFTRLCWW